MGTQIKSKKQKIIGKVNLVNADTNKVESFSVIQDSKDTDFNFHKVWIKDLVELLNIIGGQKVKVFSHILLKMNSDNHYIGSIREMAKELKLSNETVTNTLKLLKGLEQLTMIQNGVYMLNPDLILKGGSLKRQMLKAKFKGIPFETDEKKTMEPKEERDYNDLIRAREDKTIRDHHLDEFIEDLKNKQ